MGGEPLVGARAIHCDFRATSHGTHGMMHFDLPLRAAALAALWALAVVASAADVRPNPNLGRDVAATCANCHGTDGRSRAAAVASLAGRDAASIAQAMKEFRDGRRGATVMQQLAKGYTDAQVEAAAAYFAGQAKQ